jgi:DNA-binding PadR family transcriptional regulator
MRNKSMYGFWHRGERIFHKGDFKYLVLGMLKEKPMHGYEIIRDLEEKSHGFYAPSPGAVYPTLQWLEEVGYVTSSAQEGKKVYTITEAGLAFLVEREKESEDVKRNMRDWWGPWSGEFRDDMKDVMRLLGDLGRMIGHETRQAGKDKLPKVKEALSNAAKEVEKIFRS